jgi:hypothetical protein
MSPNVLDATDRLARRLIERIRKLEAEGGAWEDIVRLAQKVERLVKARRGHG